MKKYILLAFATLLLFSCSTFQKALKSEDDTFKYEVASKLYEKGKYEKAIRLFEQLAPNFRGRPESEEMFYKYSQAYYKTKQYYLAGYQFEKFSSSYPKSDKSEEAAFLGAKCFTKLSPVYSLDQADTNKAIDKLQNFIDKYPNSEYLAESNAMAKVLREKLEKKAYEIALQYNRISDYKAALVVLDNFIADYPGTPYKESALFYKLDSAYKLAENSVATKIQERLKNAVVAYNNLIKFNANSTYKEKADEMLAKINKSLEQYSK